MFPSKAINPNSILKGTANKYIKENEKSPHFVSYLQLSKNHSITAMTILFTDNKKESDNKER